MNSQEENEVRAIARAIAKEEIALALKAKEPEKIPERPPVKEPAKTKKGK